MDFHGYPISIGQAKASWYFAQILQAFGGFWGQDVASPQRARQRGLSKLSYIYTVYIIYIYKP